jgi:hypothetical protein
MTDKACEELPTLSGYQGTDPAPSGRSQCYSGPLCPSAHCRVIWLPSRNPVRPLNRTLIFTLGFVALFAGSGRPKAGCVQNGRFYSSTQMKEMLYRQAEASPSKHYEHIQTGFRLLTARRIKGI